MIYLTFHSQIAHKDSGELLRKNTHALLIRFDCFSSCINGFLVSLLQGKKLVSKSTIIAFDFLVYVDFYFLVYL